MTLVILVRHGETTFKEGGFLDGQKDTKLTEEGEKQVRDLAKKLEQYSISEIYSSTLVRSIHTAEIAKDELNLDLSINKVKNFREVDCGLCTGKNVDEIKKEFPNLIKEWDKETDPLFPKGENMECLEKRAIPVFEKIIQSNKNENEEKAILVSGHGALNLAIIGYYLQISYGKRWSIKQGNCCINILKFEEGDYVNTIKINH